MKKAWKISPILLLLGLLLTGCTPKEGKAAETQDQSGAPIIDFEVADQANDNDLDYEFVPDGE